MDGTPGSGHDHTINEQRSLGTDEQRSADVNGAVDDVHMPPWVRRAIFLWWTVLVGLWLTLIVVREIRGLLVQLALALFLSFALEPVVDRLGRRGLRRGTATALSLLVLFLATVLFFTAMGQLVATQLTDLVDNLPDYLRDGQSFLDRRFGIEVEADDLINRFQDGGDAAGYATSIADQLLSASTTIASLLFQTLTVALFTFYLTADGPRLRRSICSMLPPARQHEVLRVWELAVNKTGAYISSRFILAVISAIYHWIVFTSLNLPSAVALALWVGLISQFIPTLGTYLAGVLPVLVAVGVDPTKALWVIAAVIVYQQVENYILQPRITAQTLDLHPAISIFAVLAGTSLFGGPGALLALPLAATAGGFFAAYIERHEVVENRLTSHDEHDLVDEEDGPSRSRSRDAHAFGEHHGPEEGSDTHG